MGEPSITYDRPPLVEVAMSVQFDSPDKLTLAHLGAFWATQRNWLPQVRSAPPIATVAEPFGAQGPWLPPALQLALTNEPDYRLQMTSADDQWMCQLQRNRLVINWRKRTADYPRFMAAWKNFRHAWEAWSAFLAEASLKPAKLRLWELTYVNRIPSGSLWNTPSDWHLVFPGLWGGPSVVLEGAALQGTQGQWVWEQSDPVARLYAETRPAQSIEDPNQQVLLLNLTARGPFTDEPQSNQQIEERMVHGNRWIVSAFDAFSSATAKQAWGRHDHDH